MKILHPLTLITREEHYDDKTSLQECIRYLFTKAVSIYASLLLQIRFLVDSRNQRAKSKYLLRVKVSMSAVNALPEPETHVTTSLVEALHFRRGFHYIAVQVGL